MFYSFFISRRNLLRNWIPMLRTALFWAIKKRVVVIPYRRFGTTYLPETSEMNYQYSLLNGSEERTSYLLRGGSLKPRILPTFTTFFKKPILKYWMWKSELGRCRSQSRCGCFGEDKNLLPLPGIEQRFLGYPPWNVVAIQNTHPTSLFFPREPDSILVSQCTLWMKSYTNQTPTQLTRPSTCSNRFLYRQSLETDT
jgi:hypothetical protein